MEFNRNQFFMFGIVAVLLGLQFRMVDKYVLNEKATKILAGKSSDSTGPTSFFKAASASAVPPSRKTVHPPEWSGWCLISIGSVLILHSLALRRPD